MNITLKDALSAFTEEVEIVLRYLTNCKVVGTPSSVFTITSSYLLNRQVENINIDLELKQVIINI